MAENAPPKSKRRWPKRLLIGGLLFGGILLLAWQFVAPIASSRLEEAIEEALDVEATVSGLSLNVVPDGAAFIQRVRLVDRKGREVAQLNDLQIAVDLGELVRGSLESSASLPSATLTVYQEEDGSWSTQSLVREGEPDGSESDGRESESEKSPSTLPQILGTFHTGRIELVLVWNDKETETIALELRSSLEHVDERDRLDLTQLKLDSTFVSGTLKGHIEHLSEWVADPSSALELRGLEADLRYVPDEVRRVLEHFVEIDLEGSEEETLTLRAQGDLDDLTAAGVLKDLKANLEAGVGRLTLFDFTAEGDVRAQLKEGRLVLQSDLGLNGGAFDLQAEVDAAGLLEEEGASDTTFSVGLADVGLDAKLAPLLSALHPMLAANQALTKGGLNGTVDARVAFSVSAPLVLSQLQEDPGSFPLEALNAKGSMGLAAALSDLPLVNQLGKALGVDLSDGAKLEPFAFSIQDGRIGYDKPWKWIIDDLETTFTGSIGLDRSLDLVWNVPITEGLAGKSDFLSRLNGEQLTIPLGGSLLKPKLDLAGALQAVAGDALRDTLQDELQDQLEGIGLDGIGKGGLDGALEQLGGQLGLGGKQDSSGDKDQANDPAQLYRDANRLWKAGDKAAAQPLYRRIEKEFRLSPTFLLNRSRVKKRADWKPK